MGQPARESADLIKELSSFEPPSQMRVHGIIKRCDEIIDASTERAIQAECFIVKSHANFLLGRFHESMNCAKNALLRGCSEKAGRSALGTSLLELGRPDEALEHLVQSCKLSEPRTGFWVTAHANFAEALDSLGQREDAIGVFDHICSEYAKMDRSAELDLVLANQAAEMGLTKRAFEGIAVFLEETRKTSVYRVELRDIRRYTHYEWRILCKFRGLARLIELSSVRIGIDVGRRGDTARHSGDGALEMLEATESLRASANSQVLS